ncbi:hypothetical protein D3C87_1732320 [compost metagenome]
MLDRGAEVRENQLRALPRGKALVPLKNPLRCLVDASARLALGAIDIHEANIHGCLAAVAHDDEHVVLALLGRSLALFNDLRAGCKLLHVGVLRRRLV